MIKIKTRFLSALQALGLMSKMSRKDFKAVISRYTSSGRTLDIGCGGSPYAEFFPERVALDIAKQPGVDIVADVHEMKTIRDGEFDNVLCTEALEHFYNPFLAVAEIRRVLKPGGRLILSTRFIFPLHEVPHDYFRFTEYGLRRLLADFDILELRPDGNTLETVASLYQRIGYQCETLWFKPFKLWWFLEAKVLQFFSFVLTRQYGDIAHKTVVKDIMTTGYLLICRKK